MENKDKNKKETDLILHIVNDHRAAKSFLSYFDKVFQGHNLVLRVCDSGLTKIEKENEILSFPNIQTAINNLDFLLIKIIDVQFLSVTKIKAIVRYIPKNIPIVWWIYGGDLYNYFLEKRGYQLYAPQTKKYLKRDSEGSFDLKLKKIIHDKIYMDYMDKKIIERIVGIIPCLYPDYEQACLWLKKEFDLVEIIQRKPINFPLAKGNDILVGNSASMTNNHLYALDYMKKLDLGNSKIVLPLSYNIQSEAYRKGVMGEFRTSFGDNVEFMLNLIDKNAYRQHFQRYKMAIFPSWRQEALGNIHCCLQQGIRVVLSEHNPCYKYYKDLGFKVCALETLHDFNELLEEDKCYNRDLFIKCANERNLRVSENLKSYFSKYISI